MSYLLDTCILVRLANAADPLHMTAAGAVVELHRRGELLHVTAQNLVEFRSVSTRPTNLNGLGLATVDAEAIAATFEVAFPLLAEVPAINSAWNSLVKALAVVGKQVHDARLVAVCHVYGVSHFLTFNTGHFARLSGFGRGVIVVDPARI